MPATAGDCTRSRTLKPLRKPRKERFLQPRSALAERSQLNQQRKITLLPLLNKNPLLLQSTAENNYCMRNLRFLNYCYVCFHGSLPPCRWGRTLEQCSEQSAQTALHATRHTTGAAMLIHWYSLCGVSCTAVFSSTTPPNFLNLPSH